MMEGPNHTYCNFPIHKQVGQCHFFLGLQQHARHEFSEHYIYHWTPSRKNHFPNNLSHLERVTYRPNNLLLQSTGLTTCLFKPTGLETCLFSPTPKSIQVRLTETTKLGIDQMMETSHTQSRNYVGSNNRPLRHGTGSGKVQVCCAS
jgi:hypothetical protein